MSANKLVALGVAAVALTVGWNLFIKRMVFAESRPKECFLLLIKYRLRKPEHIDMFLEKWAALADYCKRQEPHTYAYEIAISDKDPQEFIILERYRQKEDLTDVHQQSQAFLQFKAWFLSVSDEVTDTKSGQSYIETGVGFVR